MNHSTNTKSGEGERGREQQGEAWCPGLCGSLLPPTEDLINSTRFCGVAEGDVVQMLCG